MTQPLPGARARASAENGLGYSRVVSAARFMGWQILDYRHWPAICHFRVSLYLLLVGVGLRRRSPIANRKYGGRLCQQQFLHNCG